MNESASSVSRRLLSCLEAYDHGNYETALIHFFPALDKVAKRRRPKDGVGARIRRFLADEEMLISAVATGTAISGGVFDGVTLQDAIYKFGRTPIVHEGELDPRLRFVDGHRWSLGGVWELPSSYILGLCVAVIVAPECKGEQIASEASVSLFGREWRINALWGAASEVKAHIAWVFRNPDAFI